jgi:two-component system chemotaxis response regulator CheB
MTKENIRVLIVDDSAVVRAIMSDQVAAAPGLSMAGIARNGREALAAIAVLRPDVVTLDVQMPDMDGLAVLKEILNRNPLPVIMVSALTRAGAGVTLEALDCGAVDYLAKPEHGASTVSAFKRELIQKIRIAACMDVRRLIAGHKEQTVPRRKPVQREVAANADLGNCPEYLAKQCIALGISTGGPPALTKLLGELRPPMPPIVVVQHMPPQFTGPLAARLDSISALSVREAVNGDVLQPNCVLIAPGGSHLELRGRSAQVRAVIRDGAPVSGHKPSVDVMMTGAAKIFGPNCLGVIMTGMGRDGANGCRAIREAGGYVLGQNEASSAVYGMNRVAFVEGNVDQQFGLQEAAAAITRQAGRARRPPSRVGVAANRPSAGTPI